MGSMGDAPLGGPSSEVGQERTARLGSVAAGSAPSVSLSPSNNNINARSSTALATHVRLLKRLMRCQASR